MEGVDYTVEACEVPAATGPATSVIANCVWGASSPVVVGTSNPDVFGFNVNARLIQNGIVSQESILRCNRCIK